MFLAPTGTGFIYSSFSKPQKINIRKNNKTATNIEVKSLASDIVRNGMKISDFNFEYYGILIIYFKPESQRILYSVKNKKPQTGLGIEVNNTEIILKISKFITNKTWRGKVSHQNLVIK